MKDSEYVRCLQLKQAAKVPIEFAALATKFDLSTQKDKLTQLAAFEIEAFLISERFRDAHVLENPRNRLCGGRGTRRCDAWFLKKTQESRGVYYEFRSVLQPDA